MANKGYNDGLMSGVKNAHSNMKYTISTAKELGKDYWTSTVFPKVFFGLFPNFTKPSFVIVRNNKEEAHEVHHILEDIVTNVSESEWFNILPKPLPEDGLTADAQKVLERSS